VYQIVVERAAEKDLKRLSAEVRARAVMAIKGLARNPRPAGCRKLTGAADAWRIRVGDYRIIYEIADVLRIVRINHVRHRREVYRD
jgi:mRNA interferase RelE/StbE